MLLITSSLNAWAMISKNIEYLGQSRARGSQPSSDE